MMLFRLAFITICVALSGCRAVHAPMGLSLSELAADPELSDAGSSVASEESAEAQIWPSRWGGHVDQRGVVIEMDPATPLRPVHYSRYHQGRSTPEAYSDVGRLATAMGIEDSFKFKAEGPGSFIFVENSIDPQEVKNPPRLMFKFISARNAPHDTTEIEDDVDFVAIERTWFTYRDPKPGKEMRGVVVLLPGMFGTPEPIVNATENYMVNSGFGVLRMLSHPSRYTQHLVLPYLDGRTDSIAKQAALSADQRVAECAYATDAAIKHVLSNVDGLEEQPFVLIGMSGGAMALPSVYAYTPERYDAAVLIAGGANFLRIMIESNYRDWIDAILIDFDPLSDELGRPDPGLVENLSDRYLEHTKLDAYQTAPLLREIPTLILHATKDRAVPAATGDLLYDRLGRPERWTYPLGHELIFASLPMQIPRIDTWLKDQLEGSTADDATGE